MLLTQLLLQRRKVMVNLENNAEYINELTSGLQSLLQVDESQPDRILNSTDPPSKWKKGWFAGVSGRIEILIDYVSDKELQKQMRNKTKFWISDKFAGSTPFTTQQNINEANELIRKVLVHFNR